VLLAYAERLPGGAGFHLRFSAPTQPIAGTQAARAAAINRALEDLIRSCPEQYLWGYNRYKAPRGGRPGGAAMLTRLGLALIWLLHFLPLKRLAPLGEAFGGLLYAFGRERRHIALTNLRLCYPRMPEAEREQLARAHFRAFGRSFLERGLLWWSPPERSAAWCASTAWSGCARWQASR
jgi:lauroyl/myristoyl acyltransferase